MSSKLVNVQQTNFLQLLVEIFCLTAKCLWVIFISIFYLFRQRPEKSVKEDVVLVTGAGHGIGRAIAIKYASEGATVVCWDINKKNNDDTLKEIEKLGHTKVYAYECDVTKPSDVQEVAKKVQTEVGDITILVNNAGIACVKTILESTKEDVERTIKVNAASHFWTIKAFLPGMQRRRRGHIVAICSIAGLFGGMNGTSYCASKFAVRGMMEALHLESRGDTKCSIDYTIIYPAGVETGIFKKIFMRFPNLLPIITPTEAADCIVKAQRQNLTELSIPTYSLPAHHLVRLLPYAAQIKIMDFLSIYITA